MNLKFSLIFFSVFLTSSFSFEGFEIGMYTKFFPTEWINTKVEAILINESFVKYDDKIYEIIAYRTGFVASKTPFEGFYLAQRGVKLFYFPSSKSESLQCYKDGTSYYGFYQEASKFCMGPTGSDSSFVPVTVSRVVELLIKPVTAACKANENFNTQTQKCEAPCQKGQSWDQENNKCYIDCTDKNSNKWGYPDGSCIDCSGEKTPAGVMTCYCKYFGVKPDGYDQPGFGTNFADLGDLPKGYHRSSCEDGGGFVYKDPASDPVETDNNKTGESGGGSKNPDNNSTNSGNKGDNSKDKDGNKTSPKDPTTPNQNGNQTATPANPSDPNGSNNGGGSNPGSSGGSNSGSNNNGSSGGGTTIINNGGSNGGKGNDKGDVYGTFNGKVDFSDLKSDADSYMNGLSGAIGDIKSKFDGFSGGLNQFLENVKGNGLSSFQKRAVPDSCPIDRTVSLFGKWSADIKIDLCKFAYILRPIVYYVFYLFLFVSFLILCVKLTIFAF